MVLGIELGPLGHAIRLPDGANYFFDRIAALHVQTEVLCFPSGGLPEIPAALRSAHPAATERAIINNESGCLVFIQALVVADNRVGLGRKVPDATTTATRTAPRKNETLPFRSSAFSYPPQNGQKLTSADASSRYASLSA